MAEPQREPRVEVQPLCQNLFVIVEQAQVADHATSESTHATPVESAPGTSVAPSSSRSNPPSPALVSIARVQK